MGEIGIGWEGKGGRRVRWEGKGGEGGRGVRWEGKGGEGDKVGGGGGKGGRGVRWEGKGGEGEREREREKFSSPPKNNCTLYVQHFPFLRRLLQHTCTCIYNIACY